MTIMTDAELLLGLSRHLSVFQMGPEKAALEQLEFAGRVLDVAFRLRGSTTSSAERVSAIGLDAGLGRTMLQPVIATMETLGWINVTRDVHNAPVAVAESIPAPGDLVVSASALLDMLRATPQERAALSILRATTLQPLVIEDALQMATTSTCDEAAGVAAIRHLTYLKLIRRVKTEADDREVLYNPNVWTQGDTIAQAALKAADARATSEVAALLEEVSANPGIPEAHVKATESKWVTFAISQGLVQRSVIQTSEDAEQGFLFTPHLTRGPFSGTAGDASGQVRQLVGSMIYASTFATYRLRSPAVFLSALIDRGVAGNATSIGTDYLMLEKAGVVRVIPGNGPGYCQLELLQSEVAEDALQLLTAREGAGVGSASSTDIAALRAQRSYVHVESDRAKMALTTDVDEIEQARLLAALRDVPIWRMMGGGP